MRRQKRWIVFITELPLPDHSASTTGRPLHICEFHYDKEKCFLISMPNNTSEVMTFKSLPFMKQTLFTRINSPETVTKMITKIIQLYTYTTYEQL